MADRRMFSRDILKSSVMVMLGGNEQGLAAQRVFETLILTADDHGRGRYIPSVIRMEAFGTVPETFSQITPEMIDGWCKSIQAEGALLIYEINNQHYYQLTGWDRYQRGGWQRAVSNLPEPGQGSDTERTDGGQTADTERTGDESKLNKSKVIKIPRKCADKPPSDQEYVKVWIDLYRSIRQSKDYQPTGREIGELKRIWKEPPIQGDMQKFKRVVQNYLSSPFVKVPNAKKLYESGVSPYLKSQGSEALPDDIITSAPYICRSCGHQFQVEGRRRDVSPAKGHVCPQCREMADRMTTWPSGSRFPVIDFQARAPTGGIEGVDLGKVFKSMEDDNNA